MKSTARKVKQGRRIGRLRLGVAILGVLSREGLTEKVASRKQGSKTNNRLGKGNSILGKGDRKYDSPKT